MMLVCSFKVTLGKWIVCKRNNIMHYIVLQSLYILRDLYYNLCHRMEYNEIMGEDNESWHVTSI